MHKNKVVVVVDDDDDDDDVDDDDDEIIFMKDEDEDEEDEDGDDEDVELMGNNNVRLESISVKKKMKKKKTMMKNAGNSVDVNKGGERIKKKMKEKFGELKETVVNVFSSGNNNNNNNNNNNGNLGIVNNEPVFIIGGDDDNGIVITENNHRIINDSNGGGNGGGNGGSSKCIILGILIVILLTSFGIYYVAKNLQESSNGTIIDDNNNSNTNNNDYIPNNHNDTGNIANLTWDDVEFDMNRITQLMEDIEKIATVTRVPGTSGNKQTRDFIISRLNEIGFVSWLDEFTQMTLIGNVTFVNIVSSKNPNAHNRIVLACHYDTKRSPAEFYGAIDSAAPCGMILDIAQNLSPYLASSSSSSSTTDEGLTLELHFYDGEEAFNSWTHTDSIYGSKHLAALLESKMISNDNDNDSSSHLSSITELILLDLLGSENPTLHDYFTNTHEEFLRLRTIEAIVRKSDLDQTPTIKIRKSGLNSIDKQWFKLDGGNTIIEDDHLPFLQRNVPILHIIPYPFPSVWHYWTDTYANLDIDTIDKLTTIFRIYVAEYLGLIK